MIFISTFPPIWFPRMFVLIFAQFSFQFAARPDPFPEAIVIHIRADHLPLSLVSNIDENIWPMFWI